MIALGDVAERVLRFFGVTKTRVQAVTGSKDCGCAKRQAAMNDFGYRWQQRFLRALYKRRKRRPRKQPGRFAYAAVYIKMACRVLIYGPPS